MSLAWLYAYHCEMFADSYPIQFCGEPGIVSGFQRIKVRPAKWRSKFNGDNRYVLFDSWENHPMIQDDWSFSILNHTSFIYNVSWAWMLEKAANITRDASFRWLGIFWRLLQTGKSDFSFDMFSCIHCTHTFAVYQSMDLSIDWMVVPSTSENLYQWQEHL